VTRAFVGPCVVAEAVVDDPCDSGLARPHDWMEPAVGGVLAQNRDVGIGVEVAITLIENGEVAQTLDDRMSPGAYDDGGKILLRGASCDLAPNVHRAFATTRSSWSSMWR
jgi:hypothetical protein